jgi:hypothetical protein
VDLTALGLGGCFSNFLAETRSSTSPTATLSDFVIGNFNTCKLLLPNTATVQADGIPPITSNQVLITVTDGDSLLAPSVAGGAGTDSLTAQQVQAAVAQGISAWRAAGIDPATLSNLDQVTVHLANLPGAELGFTAGGEVWIDRTAAGWGWSTGPAPAPGRMDLVTVVTHELGHVLGFEHSATGVMEAALAPGTRVVPAVLGGTGTVGATAAAPGGPGVSAGQLGVALPGAPLSASSHPETTDAAVAAAARGATAPPLTASAEAVPTAAAALLLDRAPQAPGLIVISVPAAVPAGPDQGPATILVPGLRPPAPRGESGGDTALPGDEAADVAPAAGLAPQANPADTSGDAAAQLEARLRHWACDACFADESWLADPVGAGVSWPGLATEDTGPAPDAGAAAAALAVLLAGYGVAPRMETEARRRRPSLI